MTKKEKKNLGMILIGVAAFMLINRKPQPQYRPQFQNVPPPPRNNPQRFSQWANLILQTYGDIAELWQPGGPFHNYKTADIYDTTTDYSSYV